MKSFIKQNTKLRIHSKPDRNQSKLTVCIVCIIIHFILLADDLPFVSTIYILSYANGDQCRPIDAKRPMLQYTFTLGCV